MWPGRSARHGWRWIVLLLRHAIAHDPKKWSPLFGKRLCANKQIDHDADSIEQHHDLEAVPELPGRRSRASCDRRAPAIIRPGSKCHGVECLSLSSLSPI